MPLIGHYPIADIAVSGLGGHAGDLGSLRTISTAPGGASLGVADDGVHPDPLIDGLDRTKCLR